MSTMLMSWAVFSHGTEQHQSINKRNAAITGALRGSTMPKYIDTRDSTKKTGKELFNGRISRNHKKDSENLHPYREKNVSAGKRTIRKRRYPIQPHDIVACDEKKYETSGCHCNGTRAILLPSKRSVSVKKLKIHHFSGGYFEKQCIAQ